MRRALVLAALAACGGGQAAPVAEPAPAEPAAPALPQSPAGIDRAIIERELATVEALSQRACACADEACLVTVDAEVSAYVRVATMNDPMTDVETWPSDLDDRLQGAQRAMLACFRDKQVVPKFLGTTFLRVVRDTRDAMCACTDFACVEHLSLRLRKEANDWSALPESAFDAATSAEIERLVAEMMACGTPFENDRAQQALLDIRKIRAEACACEDDACVDRVREALDELFETYKDTKGSQAQVDEMTEIATEVRACMDRVGAATE